MNSIFFLLRTSWSAVAIALATGFVSGGCSAGSIALIVYAMVQDAPPSGAIAVCPVLSTESKKLANSSIAYLMWG
jgi:putative ATP-binding cassette transporter